MANLLNTLSNVDRLDRYMPNSVSFEKRTGETERKDAMQDKADSKMRRLRFKVKGFQ